MIPSVAEEAANRHNVIVLKSLGKNCGLHGVRLGYVITNAAMASRLRHALPHWNINALGEMLIFDLVDHMASTRRVKIGSAKDMEGKTEIAKHPEFVRFLPSSDARTLQWEEKLFGASVKSFMVRGTKRSKEYVCFNQFAARDAALYATMLKACLSLDSAR